MSKQTREERQQQKQVEAEMNKLKDIISKLVDELYKSDLSMGVLEFYADDAFKSYRRMKESKSKQFDQFLKEKKATEDKFYDLKANQLSYDEKNS